MTRRVACGCPRRRPVRSQCQPGEQSRPTGRAWPAWCTAASTPCRSAGGCTAGSHVLNTSRNPGGAAPTTAIWPASRMVARDVSGLTSLARMHTAARLCGCPRCATLRHDNSQDFGRNPHADDDAVSLFDEQPSGRAATGAREGEHRPQICGGATPCAASALPPSGRGPGRRTTRAGGSGQEHQHCPGEQPHALRHHGVTQGTTCRP